MARCRAATPCEFHDDVHDTGCPARATGYSHPDLNRLYATETSGERALLGVVLEELIDRHLLDHPEYHWLTADAVTGGEVEWLAIRTAVRAHAALADRGTGAEALADGFTVEWADDAPSLRIAR